MSDTFIEAFCSNMAQQSGVAKVRMNPTINTWSGAFARGNFLKKPRDSSLFMTRGMRTIPTATGAKSQPCEMSFLTRSCHANPRGDHHGDSCLGGNLALSDLLALLRLQHDPVLELQPPHQRDVDAVGHGHGAERDESPHQRRQILGERVEAEGGSEGGAGGGHVAGAQGGERDGGVPGPVGVVHHGIEALVHPLPEDDGGRGLVEGHHAAGDGHVEGDLGGHPAGEEHLLT